MTQYPFRHFKEMAEKCELSQINSDATAILALDIDTYNIRGSQAKFITL